MPFVKTPDRFICPITKEIMLSPVRISDGTGPYERAAVSNWIEKYKTNPIPPFRPLTDMQLHHDVPLRNEIESFKSKLCPLNVFFEVINQEKLDEVDFDIDCLKLTDEKNFTTLAAAVQYALERSVVALLKAANEANYSFPNACNPIRIGQQGMIVRLIGLHVWDSRNEEQKLKNEKVERILQKLLEAGFDPNFQDDDKTTPLSIAARSGFLPGVRLLIKHHADISAKIRYRHGNTLLHEIICQTTPEIIELLLKQGIDVSTPNDAGQTPLQYAENEMECTNFGTTYKQNIQKNINLLESYAKNMTPEVCIKKLTEQDMVDVVQTIQRQQTIIEQLQSQVNDQQSQIQKQQMEMNQLSKLFMDFKTIKEMAKQRQQLHTNVATMVEQDSGFSLKS